MHVHRITSKNGEGGFSLIEVLVALTILATGLVMVMQLFSSGLRTSTKSADYTRAIIHAKEKMEEMFEEPVQGSGTFGDGFHWESAVEPHKEPEDTTFKLLKYKVKISWFDSPKKEKSFELVSLKTTTGEESE